MRIVMMTRRKSLPDQRRAVMMTRHRRDDP
jgi:hypothetical protein